MKYIEVVKAVHEEQMKKEASVKKLAGLLKKKAAGTLYGPVQPYLPGTKLNEPVSKGAGKPYLQVLSSRVAEAKPTQMLRAAVTPEPPFSPEDIREIKWRSKNRFAPALNIPWYDRLTIFPPFSGKDSSYYTKRLDQIAKPIPSFNRGK